jgi:hypothetical protein
MTVLINPFPPEPDVFQAIHSRWEIVNLTFQVLDTMGNTWLRRYDIVSS